MATHVPGAENQSITDQGPQISGHESEASVSRHLNLNILTPMPSYNPFMLMQQMGAQTYPTYSIPDSRQPHYNQQGYAPSTIHGGSLCTIPQEVHHGFQGYHPPVQEIQGFTELQQHNFMDQAGGFVQNGQIAIETRHQGQVQRILPRKLLHMRQRFRRRIRTNRPHISHVHSVATAFSNREQSTPATTTDFVTSGLVVQTPVEIEGSQERLTPFTSAAAATAVEESSEIGENFECNICIQKANEAVVTCCGHLFCWPCLYRWLHVHSHHEECPVCKGSIAECSITPIYGRENALALARMQGALGSERIPPRPSARRVESARQLREREVRERGRQPQQVETRESTNQVTEMEGEARAPRADSAPTSETTVQPVEHVAPEGAETATRLQDLEGDANQLGESTEHSQSGYVQQRLDFRREQLRQALTNSRHSAAINEIPDGRGGDRQEMLTTSAHVSQEWEHSINGSRLVVDPAQAAA